MDGMFITKDYIKCARLLGITLSTAMLGSLFGSLGYLSQFQRDTQVNFKGIGAQWVSYLPQTATDITRDRS